MKKYIIPVLMVLSITMLQGQVTGLKNKTLISLGERYEIASEILNENRILNLYFSTEYNENDTTIYDIIYLLDGGVDEDFIHVSGLVQYLSFPWIQTIRPTILVGISNVDRKRDFTFPSSIPIDKVDFPTSGKSADFIDFIDKELKPSIEKKYRTTGSSTLIGQSFGGLIATEILIKRPDLFANYIIVSPSLWWDEQSLLNLPELSISQDSKIYVGVGKEGDIMEKDALSLAKKLAHLDHLYFEFLEDKNHGDALHIAVYHALSLFHDNTE